MFGPQFYKGVSGYGYSSEITPRVPTSENNPYAPDQNVTAIHSFVDRELVRMLVVVVGVSCSTKELVGHFHIFELGKLNASGPLSMTTRNMALDSSLLFFVISVLTEQQWDRFALRGFIVFLTGVAWWWYRRLHSSNKH